MYNHIHSWLKLIFKLPKYRIKQRFQKFMICKQLYLKILKYITLEDMELSFLKIKHHPKISITSNRLYTLQIWTRQHAIQWRQSLHRLLIIWLCYFQLSLNYQHQFMWQVLSHLIMMQMHSPLSILISLK